MLEHIVLKPDIRGQHIPFNAKQAPPLGTLSMRSLRYECCQYTWSYQQNRGVKW